jgi:hypothetical protein
VPINGDVSTTMIHRARRKCLASLTPAQLQPGHFLVVFSTRTACAKGRAS